MVDAQTLCLFPTFQMHKTLLIGRRTKKIPPTMSYKRVGDFREHLIKGERIKNKSSYLLTLIKPEAKKTQSSLGTQRGECLKGYCRKEPIPQTLPVLSFIYKLKPPSNNGKFCFGKNEIFHSFDVKKAVCDRTVLNGVANWK